jgi:hypothetical protein
MRINKLAVTACLLAIVIVGVVAYCALNKLSQNSGGYTVIGTLAYAPTSAIFVGVNVTSVTPSLSPSPVGCFMFLNFSGQASRGTFPAGFAAGDEVAVSGTISFDTQSQAYGMNVTRIIPVININQTYAASFQR